jgi:hypothetical protein
MISDERDHSNDMGSWYGCPLKRWLCIIYLPAGTAWADLTGLVTDLSTGVGMEEILDTTKEIDFVRGLMGEWSDPLEVEWIDETGENGEQSNCVGSWWSGESITQTFGSPGQTFMMMGRPI